MVELHTLHPPRGAKKSRKRPGHGPGSGLGKTAGKGQKGQTSRSGFRQYPGFEGGQMPLHRRLPKRGFRNPFKKRFAIVNLDKIVEHFQENEPVTPDTVQAKGIVKKLYDGLKILGRGEVDRPLIVFTHAISHVARDKIEKVGGRVEVIR